MTGSVGVKVYSVTSVWWSACEAASEIQMVVVVVETWKVVVGRYAEKASGSMPKVEVTA